MHNEPVVIFRKRILTSFMAHTFWRSEAFRRRFAFKAQEVSYCSSP
jgi:hypothetical protein